jgi:hypothetical protein
LQLEKPRPLLRSGLLGKLGVWVGADCFKYRVDSLFKRFTLGGGGHLAFQPDCPGELGEMAAMPVPSRRMD